MLKVLGWPTVLKHDHVIEEEMLGVMMWVVKICVGYYYPTLEIVGVSNGFIRSWAILIS